MLTSWTSGSKMGDVLPIRIVVGREVGEAPAHVYQQQQEVPYIEVASLEKCNNPAVKHF